MIRIFLLFVTAIVFFTFSLYWIISENLKPLLNVVSFEVVSKNKELGENPVMLKIAVVGDTHTEADQQGYQVLEKVLSNVKEHQPDLLLFVGDYTESPRSVVNLVEHRKKLVDIVTAYNASPSAFVLGNYESWSDPDEWLRQFQFKEAIILENEVVVLNLGKSEICLRGLGDYYTKRFRYIDFPHECKTLPQITITHDPAGAFHPSARGLFISGHTHCGQVSLPFIGPLWVPTEAPKEAYCGLYQDNKRTVFTTSGVGTTVLPLRFGTQANWDLLTVQFK